MYGKDGVLIVAKKNVTGSIRSTESWVPVQSITNGMIILDNNQKFRWKGWCSYNGEENK